MLRATIERYRSAYGGLPREIWYLAAVLFINRAGAMVLSFLALYLTKQLGMSEVVAGWMVSVFGLGSVCGSFLGARLTAKFGSIRFQTVCMFLAAPGFLLIPLWSDWPAIAINLFLVSMIAEGVRPANAAAVTELTKPADRTRAFALQRLAANLGFSFGPAVGGVLAGIDYNLLFVVDAFSTLLAAISLLAFFKMRPVERAIVAKHDGNAAPSPLRDRVFLTFLCLMLGSSIVFHQFASTYPLYLRDHFRFDETWVGIMFAVNTTVIVAFEMLLVDAIKHWPLLRTIGWGCLLSCCGFGMLPFGDSAAYAIGAMLVLTLGEMLSFALASGFVANWSEPGQEGPYLGWYMLTLAGAMVVGPAVGSAIYQAQPDVVWYLSLVIGVAVLVGFRLLADYSDRTGEVEDAAPIWPDAMPQTVE